jgi:membrane-associated phospholipid phosphatase
MAEIARMLQVLAASFVFRRTIAASAVLLLLLIVFRFFPQFDLWVAGLFFRTAPCTDGVSASGVCGEFPAMNSALLRELRHWLQAVPVLVAAGLGILVMWRLWTSDGHSGRSLHYAIAALAGYVLSALFAVNLFLKETVGRPRPIHVDLFGGSNSFVPAGVVDEACDRNCSFVSGEVANAALLLVLVPLLPGGWQRIGYAAALSLVGGVAILRMAFGAHFLSDVLIAMMITILAVVLCYEILIWRMSLRQRPRQAPQPADARR